MFGLSRYERTRNLRLSSSPFSSHLHMIPYTSALLPYLFARFLWANKATGYESGVQHKVHNVHYAVEQVQIWQETPPLFSSSTPLTFSSSPVFFCSYSFQRNPNKELPAEEATFFLQPIKCREQNNELLTVVSSLWQQINTSFGCTHCVWVTPVIISRTEIVNSFFLFFDFWYRCEIGLGISIMCL